MPYPLYYHAGAKRVLNWEHPHPPVPVMGDRCTRTMGTNIKQDLVLGC